MKSATAPVLLVPLFLLPASASALAPSAPALAVGAALLALPPSGTTSRERGFCRRWLALTTPEKVDVLAGEARPGRRETLDAECRNWPLLMDFEVRAIVDR
jgi:hypothetical protein